jgi:hypothetical protein
MLSAAAAWILDAIAPNACLQTMLTVLMQLPARLGRRTAGYLSRLPNQLWDMPTLPRSHACGTFVHRSA